MKREKQLETILSIVLLLTIFYWITKNPYLLPVAAVMMAIGLLSQYLTGKFYWLWNKLTEFIGFVVSNVILTLVFFLLLFPIALLSRLFSKKDPLHLKSSSGDSYYSVRNHQYTKEDLENPW